MSPTLTVERVTLFQIPNEEDRNRVIAQYVILKKTALKDGKPYISNVSVGHIFNERAKGFTLAVKTTFQTREDLEYYENVCVGHKALKAVTIPVKTDMLIANFDNALPEL